MSISVFIFGIASAEEEIQPVAAQLNEVEPKEETPPVFAQVTEVPATVEPGTGAGPATSVELNGDTIEYSMNGNKVTAEGNVVIFYKDVTLTCDHLEFSRDTSIAHAKGNVRLLKGGESEISGEEMTFNFATMNGDFAPASIFANPYYGKGEQVSKIDANHISMTNGYITTCDLDQPHYFIRSRKIDIYPKDKLVARKVCMKVGGVPLLYLPKMTQDLTGKKPLVTFTPGYDKQWGMFLLTSMRYELNDNLKGILHLDAREKKDIASGVDLTYKTPRAGSGSIRIYYMNERSITSRHFYQPRPSPTIERERFRSEWRHKWDIDQKTNAILQYYKLSDDTILKDYFKQEFYKDSSPKTFFLLTRNLAAGVMNFRVDKRVNRFEAAVERLPELRYDLSSQKLGETGLYFRNTSIYSNLTSKQASPTEVRLETMRVDTDSELAYPMKVGIFEMRPFVGGEHTYYSKTKDPDEYNTIRGIFRTGASLSTKFYKVFDTEVKKWGLDIHHLRHIVTPGVSYSYDHGPTFSSEQLNSFDSIDSRALSHNINFSLENKLQTKRNDEVVELLRAVIGTNFALKENPGKGGFNTITTNIDFRPVDRATFYFDSTYDTREEYLTTANFDLYINAGPKWTAGIGKRWNRVVDDQVTAEFSYKINPKWAIRTYNRFDVKSGMHKEQEFTLRRDLHEWTMDINFNETRTKGSEIWIVFTLKAFPDFVVDMGTSFNKRKAGSQSSEGK
ncbi:MAG: hypothetical protein HY210_08315 [Candidatus Omnitrophica bacterium]|nr:hypothetical protein [Candidatus Omnitrophota bacterium]